jgi:hypothetical protein
MDLERLSLDELERLYVESPVGDAPAGNYRGQFLYRLPTRGAHKWHMYTMSALLFEHTRFGVDFERRLWWFLRPELAAGRFVFSPGPSRWRPTDAFRLEYAVSKLPVRGLLYDEVKPLGPDLCLGLGGVNAPRGDGDQFFFALTRV